MIRYTCLTMFALALCLAMLDVRADPNFFAPREIKSRPFQLVQRGLSRDQAAAIARQRTGGRVLAVSRQKRGKKVVYFVKVYVNGQVRTVAVDGHSGNTRR